MQVDQLKALLAVLDEGSFEGAAQALKVTPSAVSQRIKALETGVGQVVIRRGSPCTATESGTRLVRYARQFAVLEAEALAQVRDDGAPMPLAVAVNADSLATWFRPVLRTAAGWPDVELHLEIEDEAHAVSLLRSGAVIGATSSNSAGVGGCRAVPLGVVRYLPVATPELRDRHRLRGRVDWAGMPCMRFNRKDDLQAAFLRERGLDVRPPTPEVPSSTGFRDAILAGLGWGLLPEAQCRDGLRSGNVVRLVAGHRDVALWWHVWSLDSPRIARLTEAVREAARAGLRRMPPVSP